MTLGCYENTNLLTSDTRVVILDMKILDLGLVFSNWSFSKCLEQILDDAVTDFGLMRLNSIQAFFRA